MKKELTECKKKNYLILLYWNHLTVNQTFSTIDDVSI